MDELADIKRLAGITEFKGLQPYGGSNISIKWFQLWFSKPYLTGERKIND